MATILPCQLPPDSLLNRYSAVGAYTDCYVTTVAREISLAEFVEAFYTTPVFKLERLILRLVFSRPSTDIEATQLARGEFSSFAAWSVEARTFNQLLLTDFKGRTKSWLMVSSVENSNPTETKIYFGSAVTPVRSLKDGRTSVGAAFSALLGFHKLYSQVLLRAARRRLSRIVASENHVRRGGA